MPIPFKEKARWGTCRGLGQGQHDDNSLPRGMPSPCSVWRGLAEKGLASMLGLHCPPVEGGAITADLGAWGKWRLTALPNPFLTCLLHPACHRFPGSPALKTLEGGLPTVHVLQVSLNYCLQSGRCSNSLLVSRYPTLSWTSKRYQGTASVSVSL